MTASNPSQEVTRESVADVGRKLADVVASQPDVRLYVAPPFTVLPDVPGRPPRGIEFRAERVDIHIAVARLPIPPSVNALVAKLKSFLEGSGWEGADLRIWLDQLDGDNVVQDQ